MRTNKIVLCLAAAGSLFGIAGAGVVLMGSHARASQVYTVAQVRDRLNARPAEWEGRTVVVQGLAEPCPWWGGTGQAWYCADRPLVLAPGPADAGAAPLPLVRSASQQPVGFLSDLPVIGQLLPRPPAVPLLVPARFRVRLLGEPASACGEHRPCYEAQWLDATPVPRQL